MIDSERYVSKTEIKIDYKETLLMLSMHGDGNIT